MPIQGPITDELNQTPEGPCSPCFPGDLNVQLGLGTPGRDDLYGFYSSSQLHVVKTDSSVLSLDRCGQVLGWRRSLWQSSPGHRIIRQGDYEAWEEEAQAGPASASETRSLSPRSKVLKCESQEKHTVEERGGGGNHPLWSPDYINSQLALGQKNPTKALSGKPINIKQSLEHQMPGTHNLPGWSS